MRSNVSKSVIVLGNQELGAIGSSEIKEEVKAIESVKKASNEAEVKIVDSTKKPEEVKVDASLNKNTNDQTVVKSTVVNNAQNENKTTESAKIATTTNAHAIKNTINQSLTN